MFLVVVSFLFFLTEDNAPLEFHLRRNASGRDDDDCPPPPFVPPLSNHLLLSIGRPPGDGGFACCRYVLFMQTTQRLTRARRLPALKVSDWGFLNISD